MKYTPYIRKPHFHETDGMGIIHHSNYIRWLEEARVDFMEQMGYGYERSVAAGIDIAVLGVSCQYRTMVRFGEQVHIHCAITALTPSRLLVAYRILDGASGTLRSTAESSHCFFSSVKKRPVSLKKELPELYALFQAACVPGEESSHT